MEPPETTTTGSNRQRPPGLRERKKAATREAIQRHAMRLFREQGYAATTVDQIAAAAEVSPATFFRYFPAKEDVALYDAYDPRFVATLREQPPEVPLIPAIRAAFRATYADSLTDELDRGGLIATTPELRGRMIDGILSTHDEMVAAFAERSGAGSDPAALSALAGAVIGIGLAAWISSADRPEEIFGRIDAGIAMLETGFPG